MRPVYKQLQIMNKTGFSYLDYAKLSRLQTQITNKRDQILVKFLYQTGCTVNELVNVKIEHINFRNKTVKFPAKSTKANKGRICFISEELTKEIKSSIRKNSFYLLSSRQSKQITTKRVRQLIQKYSQKAGLGKINPQIIRYTHIAHAIQKEMPLKVIQKQVGMKNLRISQISQTLSANKIENEYSRFWKNEE
jgi:integrase